VESIREFGILEPLVVSPDKGGYIVVCGHRRVAAAKKAGLKECPVVVRETDAKDRELIALTENVHRRNLSPIEEAIAYGRLMKTRGLNQVQVARLMHVSTSRCRRASRCSACRRRSWTRSTPAR
jgi:ParB family chromosome partitioning protein